MNKIIDFKKSKEELINKRFPSSEKFDANFFTDSKEYLAFNNFYIKCKNDLYKSNELNDNNLINLLDLFGKYFDSIYKKLVLFENKKTPKLKEAMDYAMLSSGKRLRPFLMYITYDYCKGENDLMLEPFMLALEMIHNFSLIHDDLPCIDNDELRRGKETVWKKYGEDVAVLTGDALYMKAASILMNVINQVSIDLIHPYFSSASDIILELSGISGMLQGEFIDVMSSNKKMNLKDILFLYELKTTALFKAAILSGAILSINGTAILEPLDEFANSFGRAFQIQDDILEIEGEEKIIGKSKNSDKKNGKITVSSLIGVENAKDAVKELFDECIQIIDKFTKEDNVKEALLYKKIINYLSGRNK